MSDYPSVFVSDGTVMLTLWQVIDPDGGRPFDRKQNIGLHHVALRVPSQQALDTLHASLAQREDVTVAFCPEALGSGGARHMMVSGPSGIRIEFLAVSA